VIKEGDKEIELADLSSQEKESRRFYRNAIMGGVGLLILMAILFLLLRR
jgi:hypothetical protein